MTIKIANPNYKYLSKEKAYLLSVLAGDGWVETVPSYCIGLEVIDDDFRETFTEAIKTVYGIVCKILWNCRAYIHSKNVVADLLGYKVSFRTEDWSIPEEVKCASEEIWSSYLRGFADSEGYVKGSPLIELKSINIMGLLEIRELLNNLGIKSRIRTDNYHVYYVQITSKYNLNRFAKRIGFSIRRKQEKLNLILNRYIMTDEESWRPEQTSKYFYEKLVPQMIELRKKGNSYQKIADRLGLKNSWPVFYRLKKRGL